MITFEEKLKIQAYLDGELSPREAKKVEALLAENQEARGLYEELKLTSHILRQNQPEVKMPIPEEVFWSKVYQQIQKSDPEPLSVLDYIRSLTDVVFSKRNLVPVTATIIAIIGIFLLKDFIKPMEDHLVVIETPSEEVGSYSFRAQSEKMFVVWIYNKENPAKENGNKSDAGNLEEEILMQ